MQIIYQAVFVGVVATIVMDLMAGVRRSLWGTPSLDYALLGRWIGHLPKGQWIHRPIGESPTIPKERALGWAVHYLTGILFAAIFLSVFEAPTGPVAPVLFGIATVVAPFLLLQPGMGAGLAARRTAAPWTARARSLLTHITFGIGLWIGIGLWAGLGGA